MLNSWYETGSKIVNRHTGMAFRCRPKSFVEQQVERLGPEGAGVLFDDARESAQEAQGAIDVVLSHLSDGREWNARDLRMVTTCSTGALYLALEALVRVGSIEGPSPYEHEPTGDLGELVYYLPSLEDDPPWDDGGEEFPF